MKKAFCIVSCFVLFCFSATVSANEDKALSVLCNVGAYNHSQMVDFVSEASHFTDTAELLSIQAYTIHNLIEVKCDGNNLKAMAHLQVSVRKHRDETLKRYYEYLARTTKQNPQYHRRSFNREVKTEYARTNIAVHTKFFKFWRSAINHTLPAGNICRGWRLRVTRGAGTAKDQEVEAFTQILEAKARALGLINANGLNSNRANNLFVQMLANLSGDLTDQIALNYAVSTYGNTEEKAYLAPVISSFLLGNSCWYRARIAKDPALQAYFYSVAMIHKADADPEIYHCIYDMWGEVKTQFDLAAAQSGQLPLGVAHPSELVLAKKTMRNNFIGAGIQTTAIVISATTGGGGGGGSSSSTGSASSSSASSSGYIGGGGGGGI